MRKTKTASVVLKFESLPVFATGMNRNFGLIFPGEFSQRQGGKVHRLGKACWVTGDGSPQAGSLSTLSFLLLPPPCRLQSHRNSLLAGLHSGRALLSMSG
jgi:hypothetical protein